MNPRFWKWIFIGLAFGVGLELLKAPIRPSVQIAGFAQFDAILDEGKPLYGHANLEENDQEFKRRRRSRKIKHIADTDEPSAQSDAPAPAIFIAAKPQPSPTPTAEEAKKKAEEAKKKALLKKKKERAKKIAEARKRKRMRLAEEEEMKRFEIEVIEAEKKRRQSSQNNGDLSGSTTIFLPTPTPTPPPTGSSETAGGTKVPQSVREWESSLLKDPNAAKTAEFIKYYQSGQIKKEVYYSIVRLMTEDNRPAMRKIGIQAAEQTPDAQSFSMLAALAINEPDQENKALAEKALQDYSLPENVRHLSSVINSATEPQLTYLALTLFKQSVDTNLKTLNASQQGDPRNNTNMAALIQQYSSFVPVLQNFLQTGQDPQLNQNAAQVLNELTSILGAIS